MTAWNETREALRREAIGWAGVVADCVRDESHRWRFASALHKTIRRGYTAMAAQAAHDLVRAGGEWYGWYRLTTVAFEDVGAANPELAAKVLLASRDRTLRAQVGTERLAAFLAAQLAGSGKDRTVCDLLLSLDASEVKGLVEELKAHSMDEAIAVATDRNEDWRARLAAFQLLRHCQGFDIAVEALDLPWPVRDAARHKSAAAGMPALLPLVVDLVRQLEVTLTDEATEQMPILQGLTACSYDQYTREGRRSFAALLKLCDPVRAFFERHPVRNRIEALGLAVFEAEGGLLNRKLTAPLLAEIRSYAKATYVRRTTLTIEQFAELEEVVRVNLPALHQCRDRVLSETGGEAATNAPLSPTGVPGNIPSHDRQLSLMTDPGRNTPEK